MREAVIVAATRTPVGRRNGVFAEVRADDLAADVLEEVVKRASISSTSSCVPFRKSWVERLTSRTSTN